MMKVILLQDIRGIGKKHDVKDVSDGHAKNFLFPRGLARPATQEALKELAMVQQNEARNDAELEKRLREIARTLKDHFIEFPVKADEKGSVFGSVTKEMILKTLREHQWLGPERAEILLDHPLKELGEHNIKIILAKGIETEIKITLRSQ